MHLLSSGVRHLLTDDRFDSAAYFEAERQPGEDPRGLAPNVPGPNQKAVTGNLRISRVIAKRADEELRESSYHYATVPALVCRSTR